MIDQSFLTGKAVLYGNFVSAFPLPTTKSGLVIKSGTVSEKAGRYYVSVLVDCKEQEKLPKSENKIGIDLGIKEFCITSDGEMIENPKYLRKSEKKLRKLQKDLSRCKKGSKNREKCRVKVAKQH